MRLERKRAMMEILETVLWIIATPILLFVGLAWLGFILGLMSDPYYGIKDLNGEPRQRLVKLLNRYGNARFRRKE